MRCIEPDISQSVCRLAIIARPICWWLIHCDSLQLAEIQVANGIADLNWHISARCDMRDIATICKWIHRCAFQFAAVVSLEGQIPAILSVTSRFCQNNISTTSAVCVTRHRFKPPFNSIYRDFQTISLRSNDCFRLRRAVSSARATPMVDILHQHRRWSFRWCGWRHHKTNENLRIFNQNIEWESWRRRGQQQQWWRLQRWMLLLNFIFEYFNTSRWVHARNAFRISSTLCGALLNGY